ncbi:hypothetical protein [Arthrobacter globiformis]|uniref:hypothetical protein n=1 Tax=Arthrobacter globiformis TaxID=1665 RepID=UPI00278201EA|nr:hypothetical protein [Arthrobacter globiformis]MDQ0864785.1 hypothetical protein [Arthrobacter globiformis]
MPYRRYKDWAGKRTISLNPQLVKILVPLVASRTGKDMLFTTPEGKRIIHKLYWHQYWVPAVKAAQARGLDKPPWILDLRRTQASGVELGREQDILADRLPSSPRRSMSRSH